jgi:hypothetical protein
MNIEQARGHLTGTLIGDEQNRYHFACKKIVLFVRLVGARAPIRFAARDKVAFRIDAENFTVEDLKTRIARKTFPWNRIESLVAGEPESDNYDLFQG